MKRMRKLLAALLALSGSVAFAQVNGKFQNVDAKGGYTVNGAAPNGDTLCGNGSIFVPAASCGAAAFYQTIFNSLGVAQTQEPATQFSANFALTTSGGKTGIDLTPNISVNAATATLAANSNAVGGVALSGLCQTGGAGCPAVKLTITARFGATTPTGGGSGSASSNSYTWPNGGFSDNSYTPVCTPVNATSAGTIGATWDITGTNAAGIVIRVISQNSDPQSYGGFDCIAIHD